MGTVSLINSDLTTLLGETKRRNADLRQACEKSLFEIKALTSSSKSEQEVLHELSQSSSFPQPFLLACSTKNGKYCSIAVQGLQKVIASHSLSKSRLSDVLDSFQDATHLGVEIQLKILQSLPPLIEKYGEDIGDELLSRTIQLCAILQSSKIAVVVNTAAATLQQLSIAVFDGIVMEDGNSSIETIAKVPIEDGKSQISVKPAAYDAFRVFQDICFLTEGNKPKFLKIAQITETFGLELIESIISNHPTIFNSHPEQTYILRTYVFPYILRSLSERKEFSIVVRVIRILYLILRRHLAILPVECEVSLTLLTHMLDADSMPYWKRVLAMEVFQGIFAEFALVRKIYGEYDSKEGRYNVLRSVITAINKLSGERSSAMGLRRSSTGFFPQMHGNSDSTSDNSTVSSLLNGAVGISSDTPGLSIQNSSIRVLCIDQLDKTEPPAMPELYLYYLTLTCINSLADGITRFLLPLSLSDSNSVKKKPSRQLTLKDDGSGNDSGSQDNVPEQIVKTKRRAFRYKGVPINPLALESHPLKSEIEFTAGIIQNCWPPLLAAFSTFLYSNLDSDLFHNLVRSFQKFTQSAGLLELVTPRDALLTTLAKVAVPSQLFSGQQASPERSGIFNNTMGLLSMDTLVSSGTSKDYSSTESTYGMLHVRNLLCLRALLNLAIALGPTLKESWSIIIETLQQADLILHSNGRRYNRTSVSVSSPKSDAAQGQAATTVVDTTGGNITSEVAAVDNAVRKLLDCTRDFPDSSFLDLITAFCKTSSLTINLPQNDGSSASQPVSPISVRSREDYDSDINNSLSSKNSISINRVLYGDPLFCLIKLGELADLNISRLVFSDPSSSGWEVLVHYFTQVQASRNLSPSIRMRAAEVLNPIIYSAVVDAQSDSNTGIGEIQNRCLKALEEEMYSIIRQGEPDTNMELSIKSAEAEIHCTALNTLNDILERSGVSLSTGWETVFTIVTSVFVMHYRHNLLGTTKILDGITLFSRTKSSVQNKPTSDKVSKLIKAAFGSLQLICNDFMSVLPKSCFLDLIDLLFYFCNQQEDLNISLTTITLFWTVSDFLRSKLKENELSSDLSRPLRSKDELLEMAMSDNLEDSTCSLWLLLLLRLTTICFDSRPEVRNGSIQILFRIFDSYGHLLGANSWSACLWIVISTVMEVKPPASIPAELLDSGLIHVQETERKQWSETMALILSGLSRLHSTFLYAFSQQSDFTNIWSSLLEYFRALIALGRAEIIVSVFKSLTDILQSVEDSKITLPDESISAVWNLWVSQQEMIITSENNSSGVMTQEALTAYVNSFKRLYTLMEGRIETSQIEETLNILKNCLLFPELPPYFSDIDYLTPLQSAIIELMKGLTTFIPGSASLLLRYYSEFSSLAYRQDILSNLKVRSSKAKKPTYISVSIQCFNLLLGTYDANHSDSRIYEDGSLAFVLEMLTVPMIAKYDCPAYTGSEGSYLTLWMTATNAFIKIVSRTIPIVEDGKALTVEQKVLIWEQIVSGTSAVVNANAVTSGSSLLEDEMFDINAYKELEALIVPYLGDCDIPDSLIHKYITALFCCSFMYAVDQDVKNSPDHMNDKLMDILSSPLYGSTEALSPLSRQNMGYKCLESLFNLCKVERNYSHERRRLSETALPYLLYRCALTLHMFAADQSVSGTIPIQRLQYRELKYILNYLQDMAEELGVDDTEESRSNYRPLLKLFPLLSKGITASRRETVILNLFQGAFEKLGKVVGA
ncbi:hypothetical protein V1511DRAFT_509168 [Dipodascopsis uninucleata]